jgi:hypothetical protein
MARGVLSVATEAFTGLQGEVDFWIIANAETFTGDIEYTG